MIIYFYKVFLFSLNVLVAFDHGRCFLFECFLAKSFPSINILCRKLEMSAPPAKRQYTARVEPKLVTPMPKLLDEFHQVGDSVGHCGECDKELIVTDVKSRNDNFERLYVACKGHYYIFLTPRAHLPKNWKCCDCGPMEYREDKGKHMYTYAHAIYQIVHSIITGVGKHKMAIKAVVLSSKMMLLRCVITGNANCAMWA